MVIFPPHSCLHPSISFSSRLSFPTLLLSVSFLLPHFLLLSPFYSSLPLLFPTLQLHPSLSVYYPPTTTFSVTFPPATLTWDTATPERSWVHTGNGGFSCRTLTQGEEGGASRKNNRFCGALPLPPYLCQKLCQQHARLHFGMYFDWLKLLSAFNRQCKHCLNLYTRCSPLSQKFINDCTLNSIV